MFTTLQCQRLKGHGLRKGSYRCLCSKNYPPHMPSVGSDFSIPTSSNQEEILKVVKSRDRISEKNQFQNDVTTSDFKTPFQKATFEDSNCFINGVTLERCFMRQLYHEKFPDNTATIFDSNQTTLHHNCTFCSLYLDHYGCPIQSELLHYRHWPKDVTLG